MNAEVEKMKKITPDQHQYLEEAAANFSRAGSVVALTGAGISVESGIDDFRSPGGLWSKFSPDEYATLHTFRQNPEKAWKLYRALGRGIIGKQPNPAHRVLAQLEQNNMLKGVVTQNVDNLHQDGGSRNVLEIHGDHRHLQCLGCGDISPLLPEILADPAVPECGHCQHPLKPNVVLFGENVRYMDDIQLLIHRCDLLMVIGTSAQVYPAATIPEQVKGRGGKIYEFNIEETVLSRAENYQAVGSDYLFQGSAAIMLQLFYDKLAV